MKWFVWIIVLIGLVAIYPMHIRSVAEVQGLWGCGATVQKTPIMP